MKKVLLLLMLLVVPCLAKSPFNLLAHTNRHLPYNLDSPYISADSLSIRFNGIYAWGTGVDDTMYMNAREAEKFDYFVGVPPSAGMYGIMWNSQYYKLEACEGDTFMKPRNNWQVPSYKYRERGEIRAEEDDATWNTSWFVSKDSSAGLVLNELVDSIHRLDFQKQIIITETINPKLLLEDEFFYIGARIKVPTPIDENLVVEAVICSLSIGMEYISENKLDTVFTHPLIITVNDVKGNPGYYKTHIQKVESSSLKTDIIQDSEPKFLLPFWSTGITDFWIDYIEISAEPLN